jgi:hypothetical protein
VTRLDEIRAEIFVPDVVTTRERGARFGTLQRRRTPTDSEILAGIAAAGVTGRPRPAPRAPRPPAPRPGQVIPFPQSATGPSAAVVKGLLKRAGGVIGLAFAFRDILSMIEEEQQIALERQIEADVAASRRRIARNRDFTRDVQTLPLPDFGEIPGESTSPRPEIFPEIPEIPAPIVADPVPEPVPAPETFPSIPAPTPAPVPAPSIPAPALPSPQPSTRPATTPRPAPTPRRAPSRRFLPSFFPVFRPVSFPSSPPIGRPATNPTNLTGIEPVVPQFPAPTVGTIRLPTPQPQPQPQQERCREVKRRRRRKGLCKEGFFREFPNRTQFIEWREVDCITREPIGGPTRELIDAAENIIDFPGA